MSLMVDEHVHPAGLTVVDGSLTGFPAVSRDEARAAVVSWLLTDTASGAGASGANRFAAERDRLFAGHPDSDDDDGPPLTFTGPSITGAGP